MIGIFDSGAGGEYTLRVLRDLAPQADVCLLADRENAPYGTKDEATLVRLVRRNIRRLKDAGCDEILIGCCTASTVYHLLSKGEQHSVYPIIDPTARAAVSGGQRIGVIATEATVRSRAFTSAIKKIAPRARVSELAIQALVSMIESGVTDARHTEGDKEKIRALLSPMSSEGIDTLILGCTHFPFVCGIISEIFRDARIISSAHEGVKEITKHARLEGAGRTFYI